MRFESVTARAFGPFRNQTLKLASGMNIVYGPNESGKSSWHAALQAGLCGAKDQKGPPTKQERDFEKQRKPWHGTANWEVEAVVALADGRRIELRHDLAAKSGRARDADLAGVDYSTEISDRAAPNGARWLGMSRASFLGTACVRQSEVLGVREGADDLQDALSKAADKAGKDVTAATALDLLASYRKYHVGSQRAPTKPLRRAKGDVYDAKRRLDHAKKDLSTYLDRQREVKTLERQLAKQQQRIEAMQAGRAERVALEASRRASRVRELRQSLGDGPPSVAADDVELAGRVATAVAAWEGAPAPREPRGETCEDLDRKRLVAHEERARLDAAKPRWRPMYSGLLLGLCLLVGACASFWVQTTAMMLIAGICSIAGFGTIGWVYATGRRKAADDHARQVKGVFQRIRSLEDQIERRRAADSAYLDAVRRRDAAHQELRQAAHAAGVRDSQADVQVVALRDWQAEHRRQLDGIDEETRRWGELQTELAEQSFEKIEAEAEARRKEADTLRQGCDPADLDVALAFVDDLPGQLLLEKKLQGELNRAKGALAQFAGDMTSIADAEDDYEDAKRRLHHLEALDQTLTDATEFIARAQKGVYRDMAGVLRNTLLEWLPQVTAGRYSDCRVNPTTILVEVRESQGEWRDAGLLSHGTAEQVYLLLRLALCRHLVAENETCPLILDDPVSSCDGHRLILILETLLAISAETQVILFTHDDNVRNWGHSQLSDANNSQVLELASAQWDESATDRLGTRIANRFQGAQLTDPFEELRGASVSPLGFP